MLHVLLPLCTTCRANQLLQFALLLGLFLVPKIHAAQQLHISSPLPQLQVTSPYGMRIHPISGQRKMHYGVDFKTQRDTIRNIICGKVLKAAYNPKLGNFITIKNGNLEITYAHLNCSFVKQNEFIDAGAHLGISGSTGLSTAEHLHLSIKINGKFVNPISFLKEMHGYQMRNAKRINKQKSFYQISEATDLSSCCTKH